MTTPVAAAFWAALLAQQAAAGPATLPAPSNGDFARAERGVPVGWSVSRRTGGDPGIRLATTPEGTARLSPDGVPAGQWTRFVQRIDAAPWRGKVVRLSARVRVVDPGEHVGLRLAVERPDGLSGYYDQMSDSPLAAGGWRAVSLTGIVADDAAAVEIGAMLRGAAEIEIDDVRLEELPAGGAPISAESKAYLDSAIAFVRNQHMDASKHDWARLAERAYRQASGAKTPRDVYPAIRGILSAMGDNHAFLRPPRNGPARGAPGAPATAPPLPGYRLIDGRFGLVSLPALSMLGNAELAHGRAYVARLREGLAALDDVKPCGWIVDLRGNGGGNMWPMLNGLTPLLGRPPFGSFVRAGSVAGRWTLDRGVVTIEGADPANFGLGFGGFGLRHAQAPVAVLIGPGTASSGEAVAIAFAGRPLARSFGQASAGFTSANVTFPLPDGAVLAVPASWEADRTGREYRARITPDETVADGMEIGAAKAWLAAQCEAKTR